MWVPIWVKAAGIVTLIVSLALALIVMLNFFRFEETLQATTETRLGFIAKDLRGNIQTGLDLGLELSAMSNVQSIIEREAAADPRILGIDVFDDAARIIFSTQAGAVEQPIPAIWRAVSGSAGDAVWEASDGAQMVVGTRLTSNFGSDFGGVALRYSRASFEQQLQRMLDLLIRLAIFTLIMTALMSLVVSWLVLGGTARRLARMRSAVETALTHPDGPAFCPGRHPIEQEYALADKGLRERLRRAETGGQER
jgi:hypothetical protein